MDLVGKYSDAFAILDQESEKPRVQQGRKSQPKETMGSKKHISEEEKQQMKMLVEWMNEYT